MGDGHPDALGIRLADELDAARQVLETLAVQLCLDPAIVTRHPEPLQGFDYLGQLLGEVAGVLRFDGAPGEAIGAIRLEALRQRLAAA